MLSVPGRMQAAESVKPMTEAVKAQAAAIDTVSPSPSFPNAARIHHPNTLISLDLPPASR